MNKTDVSNRLRISRATSGLSQDELGRRSGVDRARISRIERGYIVPSAREADALARVLGLHPGILFGSEED